jgi:3-deoxy-manno-octulosonate cytidylyltransferase (CMP-KDO synthetase)
MNIVGIIPSRYASTRLPAKSLADICGKPMIRHVYEQAKKSRLLNDVIVATDDVRIETAVKAFGGHVVMTSADIHSGSDRIAVVAKDLDPDIVVNIQGDEPLIEPLLIDRTIQDLIDDNEAVVSTPIKKISLIKDIFNTNVVKVVFDRRHYALYFSRAPIPLARDARSDNDWLNHSTYYKHFGLYVYRADFLQKFTTLAPSILEQTEKLEQLRLLENGYRIKCTVTEFDSYPVDTAEDLEQVRSLMQSSL